MKLLAILGSPRRGGNSEILLDQTIRGARGCGLTTEKVVLRDLRISPCLEIYQCAKAGVCAIDDDMQPLLGKITSYDRLVVASPVFFYNVSAQTKAMIDRCQALWARRYLLQEPVSSLPERQGAYIAVGATRGRKLFVGIKLTMRYFFDAIDVRCVGELLVRGADEMGAVREQKHALDAAYDLGCRLAQLENEQAG
ncbi:MAG: flavodoxin family protein [Deltaproteobacteria bacterium]|nr:flavodoxin family protein [Deltaproteobacteria bacterium]